MPFNYAYFSLLLSCNHKHESIERKVWFPVKIVSNKYTTTLGLYSFEFESDSTLATYTLGTQHKNSSTVDRSENEITFKTEQDSLTVSDTVSDNKLIINFDTDTFNGNESDLTEKLDRILISQS